MNPAMLIDQLIASGVDEAVAEFVWDRIGPYYGEGDIFPHRDDDLDHDAGIDPEDVEDIVADFFRRFALAEPSNQKPEMIPMPLSIDGFARYLHDRLHVQGQDSDAPIDSRQRSPKPA